MLKYSVVFSLIDLQLTIGYNQWRLLKTLLSTVTKRNSEDKTLYLHVNQPLVMAAVVASWASFIIFILHIFFFVNCFYESMGCLPSANQIFQISLLTI